MHYSAEISIYAACIMHHSAEILLCIILRLLTFLDITYKKFKDPVPLVQTFFSLIDVAKPGMIFFKSGDKVHVNLTLKAFRQLQTNINYGGWVDSMEQVSTWVRLI